MKKNSGISIIALVVTVIVIIILASIVTTSGLDSIDETAKSKIDVEIRNLKDAVSDRMVNNAQNPTRYPLVGKKVDDVTEYIYYVKDITNEEIKNFIQSINEENIDSYRLVDYIAANALGVQSIDTEHYYIVDYSTGKVYGTIDMKEMEAANGGT